MLVSNVSNFGCVFEAVRAHLPETDGTPSCHGQRAVNMHMLYSSSPYARAAILAFRSPSSREGHGCISRARGPARPRHLYSSVSQRALQITKLQQRSSNYYRLLLFSSPNSHR